MLQLILELCEVFYDSLALFPLGFICDFGNSAVNIVDSSGLMVSAIRAREVGFVLR